MENLSIFTRSREETERLLNIVISYGITLFLGLYLLLGNGTWEVMPQRMKNALKFSLALYFLSVVLIVIL